MMDGERTSYLDSIVDRLVELDADRRNSALTLLYNLRTAAVEDVSALNASESRSRWDNVLESYDMPHDVRTLIHDLIQLTDDELTMIAIHARERTGSCEKQAFNGGDDRAEATCQKQFASSAGSEDYIDIKRGLALNHQEKVAERMKAIRDAIEQGIENNQDVAELEEIFERLEREFWEQCPSPPAGTGVKIERE